MARIFTTRFTFNHQNYDAIVSIMERNGRVNFSVKVMDLELHKILPDGTIVYEGEKGYEELEEFNNTVTQSLLRTISKSIAQRLTIS